MSTPTNAAAAPSAISCTSSSYCVAAGTGVTEVWNGSSWSLASTPSYGTSVSGISCVGPNDCFAVGEAPVQVGAILQWDGSSWRSSGTDGEGPLLTISCSGADACTAIGTEATINGMATPPIAEQWNGVAWSTAPAPTTNPWAALFDISCTTPSSCTAVGYTSGSNQENTLVEDWNGATWTTVGSPNDPAYAYNRLQAISCVGPSFCVAVGALGGGSSASVSPALVEIWNGASWTITPGPGPSQSGLASVSCSTALVCSAVGSQYNPAPGLSLSVSTYGQERPAQVVGMASTSAEGGYREVGSDGSVAAFGSTYTGSLGGAPLNQPIVGMASTPTGDGDWEVASDGGVFSFGDAQFYGSTGSLRLNKPIVGIAATTDGRGYWMVASDGGVFSYGDAQFRGSMGGTSLNQPVVGMAVTPDGGGYWLVAADGGIFSFGDARFSGSTGAMRLNQPVVGMAATQDGGATTWSPPMAGSSVSATHRSGGRWVERISANQWSEWPRPRAGTATGSSRPTAGSSASGVLRFSGRGSSRAVMGDRQIRVG